MSIRNLIDKEEAQERHFHRKDTERWAAEKVAADLFNILKGIIEHEALKKSGHLFRSHYLNFFKREAKILIELIAHPEERNDDLNKALNKIKLSDSDKYDLQKLQEKMDNETS